jgi:hypothetical protein
VISGTGGGGGGWRGTGVAHEVLASSNTQIRA